MRLGFVGTGVITEAIVTGLLRTDLPDTRFIVSPRSAETAARLAAASWRVSVATDNQAVVDGADLVFLAVRPQIAEDVIRPLRFRAGQVVSSLIATLPAAKLQGWIAAEVEISRAIPLPMVADCNGVTAVYPAKPAPVAVFSALGSVIDCETIEQFDACAVAGSLMGVYFGFAEAATQQLVTTGMPYGKGRAFVAHLFLALAETALTMPQQSFEMLRVGHSTPGGLNAQVFEHFMASGGDAALADGMDAVLDRIRKARAPE